MAQTDTVIKNIDDDELKFVDDEGKTLKQPGRQIGSRAAKL